jgi:hypothetical protein
VWELVSHHKSDEAFRCNNFTRPVSVRYYGP